MNTASAPAARIRVTLVRSLAKRTSRQRACVRGLGLRRLHHSVEVNATPENLGMIRAVGYLLRIEEIGHASE
jgi:large subunit ribosomal protein L30